MDKQQLAAAEGVVLAAFVAQDALNAKVNPEWITQGWAYSRAIWREAAEVFDHLNWMWWKNGTYGLPINDEQRGDVHVELVDILHFGLSLDTVRAHQGARGIPERARDYALAFGDPASLGTLEDAVESLIVDAILLKEFNVKKFALACRHAGLSFEMLMAIYRGKVVLNKFRWANGYQEKTYRKMWQPLGYDTPKEDNYYMLELVRAGVTHYQTMGPGILAVIGDGTFENSLAGKLEQLYMSLPPA